MHFEDDFIRSDIRCIIRYIFLSLCSNPWPYSLLIPLNYTGAQIITLNHVCSVFPACIPIGQHIYCNKSGWVGLFCIQLKTDAQKEKKNRRSQIS